MIKKRLFTLMFFALLIVACAPITPNDFPPAPPTKTRLPVLPTETSEPNSVPADANLYSLVEGGFTMVIPAGWSVAGPLQVNDYNLYRFGPDPSASGGPDSGDVIIADASALTIGQFAQQMCSICPLNPVEDAQVGGLPAKRTQIGGGSAPAREWYFVERNGKLIGLSFVPAGDAPVDWIIGTLHFDSTPSPASAAANRIIARRERHV